MTSVDLPTEDDLLERRIARLERETRRLNFELASPPYIGSVLRLLAASKPGGRLLELGTGTGIATAWLLSGMSPDSRLISVDNDPAVQEVAGRELGTDRRLTLVLQDGAEFLTENSGARFEMIFADSVPGKHDLLDAALRLVAPGGLYVVDDMRARPDRPADSPLSVERVRRRLLSAPGFFRVAIPVATEMLILVRKAVSEDG